MESKVFTYEDISVVVHPTGDEKQWYMTLGDVAGAYNVSRATVYQRVAQGKGGLQEGIHIGKVGGLSVLYREGVLLMYSVIRGRDTHGFYEFAKSIVVDNANKAVTPSSTIDHVKQHLKKAREGLEDIQDRLEYLEHLEGIFFGIDAYKYYELFTDASKERLDALKEYLTKVKTDETTGPLITKTMQIVESILTAKDITPNEGKIVVTNLPYVVEPGEPDLDRALKQARELDRIGEVPDSVLISSVREWAKTKAPRTFDHTFINNLGDKLITYKQREALERIVIGYKINIAQS
jgi:hypothetical protein